MQQSQGTARVHARKVCEGWLRTVEKYQSTIGQMLIISRGKEFLKNNETATLDGCQK